ncbi:hypothetical protein AUC68_05540 [Methyloceanibacter methanicus]|uniref:Uncharacterized protein n=1 Tax=Methyloceanibacter methanicus TaxID=1774968 RepID=A0A1E3W1N0_9HYPH|nr:hypothetical protein AUC68_05540 [Methyloceanibacter methanicus]
MLIGAALVLFLTSIRFFWSVGVIEACIVERIDKSSDIREDDGFKKRIRFIMLFDVPCLLAHSFIFYVLCEYLYKIAECILGDPAKLVETVQQCPATETMFHIQIFLFIFSVLLIVNAIWLFTLRTEGNETFAEFFWMISNAVTAALSIIVIIFAPSHMSYTSVMTLGLVLFMANTVADLWCCARIYTVDRLGKPRILGCDCRLSWLSALFAGRHQG